MGGMTSAERGPGARVTPEQRDPGAIWCAEGATRGRLGLGGVTPGERDPVVPWLAEESNPEELSAGQRGLGALWLAEGATADWLGGEEKGPGATAEGGWDTPVVWRGLDRRVRWGRERPCVTLFGEDRA